MKLRSPVIIIGLLALLIIGIFKVSDSSVETVDLKTQQQIQLGQMVEQLQQAIKTPENEKSLNIIQHYGTDTRYYLMVRGWLVQVSSGVESQLSVQQAQPQKQALQIRYDALQKAIRLIDLE